MAPLAAILMPYLDANVHGGSAITQCHIRKGFEMKRVLNVKLALVSVALMVWPVPSEATDINVGGGSVKVDEGGVSVGNGAIEVTPDGIKVPGVNITTGVNKQSGNQKKKGGSATGQVFNGTDFSNTDFTGRDFSKSKFVSVDFSGSNLSNANFTGAVFQGVDFGRTNLSGSIVLDAQIQGDDFSRANLTRANFSRANLQGADFSRANLSDACFVRANLVGNDFSRSRLNGAVFVGANNLGNDFGRVDLSAAVWKGASDCLYEESGAARPKVTTAAAITEALVQGKDARVDLTVNFEFDSDRIEAQGHAQVLEIATALKSTELAEQRVMIEGHTDNVGNDKYNVDLSYRRSITVMRALTEQYRIDHSRVQVKGFGEARPVADNDTDAGRAINRRVTLVNLGGG